MCSSQDRHRLEPGPGLLFLRASRSGRGHPSAVCLLSHSVLLLLLSLSDTRPSFWEAASLVIPGILLLSLFLAFTALLVYSVSLYRYHLVTPCEREHEK